RNCTSSWPTWPPGWGWSGSRSPEIRPPFTDDTVQGLPRCHSRSLVSPAGLRHGPAPDRTREGHTMSRFPRRTRAVVAATASVAIAGALAPGAMALGPHATEAATPQAPAAADTSLLISEYVE